MTLKYQEVTPPEHVAHIVKRYFIIEYPEDSLRQDYLLPDGTPSFFYVKPYSGFFEGKFYEQEEHYKLSEGIYVGFGNTLLEYQHRSIKFVGANIYPIYLHLLFGASTDRFMNTFVRLEDLNLPKAVHWQELSDSACRRDP